MTNNLVRVNTQNKTIHCRGAVEQGIELPNCSEHGYVAADMYVQNHVFTARENQCKELNICQEMTYLRFSIIILVCLIPLVPT